MKKLIMHVWAKITNGKVVWLKDFDGDVNLSIARFDAFGELYAYRYWPIKVRRVVLIQGGTVENGLYVHKWKYA